MDRADAEAFAALRRKVSFLYQHLGLDEMEGAGYTSGFTPEVLAAVQEGSLIEAIKHHRAATGVGLAEAKADIDELVRQRKSLGL